MIKETLLPGSNARMNAVAPAAGMVALGVPEVAPVAPDSVEQAIQAARAAAALVEQTGDPIGNILFARS